MEKRVIIASLILVSFVLSFISFISAESLSASSYADFSTGSNVQQKVSNGFWCLNNVLVILAAFLLLLAGFLLVKRSRKTRKSKKKKQ